MPALAINADARRRGSLIVLGALLMPLLFAVLGLALDFGLVYDRKRRQQNAANAGAIGGAHELWRGNTGLVTSAANSDTKRNGFDDTDSDTTVTVTHPYACAAGLDCVEVIIDDTAPTFFARIFGTDTITVQSRAVAGLLTGYTGGCVFALDPADKAALMVPGTSNLLAECDIMVNSDSPKAVKNMGGACITTTDFGVSGGDDSVSNCPETVSPVEGMPPVIDPLFSMDPPMPPFSDYNIITDLIYKGGPLEVVYDGTTLGPVGGVQPLVPGVYNGGIKLSGDTYDMAPGIYIMDGGGFELTSGTVITGIGVMIYNTNTTGKKNNWMHVKIAGTVEATLKAPSTGYYKGVLFFNDRDFPDTEPGAMIVGTSASTFEGVLYFSSVHLKFAGTSRKRCLDRYWLLIHSAVNGNERCQRACQRRRWFFAGLPDFLKKVTLLE